MSDVLLPPWVTIARLQTHYLDNTGITRGLYTQAPETTSFGGDRLRLSLEFTPKLSSETDSATERAALRAFLARLRGRQNRAYLWDPSYRRRGSFPAVELLSNNTFANGTTGWSPTNCTLSVSDRRLRLTASRGYDGSTVPQATSGNFTTVAYAPYVVRQMTLSGRGNLGNAGPFAADAVLSVNGYGTYGLQSAVIVPTSTSTQFIIVAGIATSGYGAGDYVDVPYVSASRCALVDNGPNSLLRSDEFDNAAWTKNGATVPSVVIDPQGGSTADLLRENSANSAHEANQSVTVSSAAGDYAIGVALRSNGRNFARLVIAENTGSSAVSQFFNLSTGAVGATGSTGANWSNRRAFTVSLGNGWFACYLVGRKTNAATSLTVAVQIASADTSGGETYLGNGTDGIAVWRATLAQSGVPTRLVQTTSVATTGTSQTGSALYVKGLPASTSGLLLPDDRFEVITSLGSELKIVTAPLNSDAAGLGYLQFEPPLRGIPADNAAIIVHEPMTRAMFAGDMVGWDDSPGMITTASAEFEEA